VQRTQTELKIIRLELAEKLYTMKAILTRPGRGGGWASYLRSEKLRLSTADRYVDQHESRLCPPEKKLLSEELYEPTVDDIREFGEKLLPKLCRMLTTQQSVFWFVEDVIMQLPAADGRRTKAGYEVLIPTPQDDVANQQQHSTLPTPTPKVPQRSSLALLYSQAPR